MIDPNDIIVIQYEGQDSIFNSAARSHRLDEGVDFSMFCDAFEAEARIFDNQPQLVIIGPYSKGREREDLYEFTRRARRNRQLVIVGYSFMKLDPRFFDRLIEKTSRDAFSQVVEAISEFRDGSLRAKPA